MTRRFSNCPSKHWGAIVAALALILSCQSTLADVKNGAVDPAVSDGAIKSNEPMSQTIPTFGGSDFGLRIVLQAIFGIPLCGIGPAVPLLAVPVGIVGMKWSARRKMRRR